MRLAGGARSILFLSKDNGFRLNDMRRTEQARPEPGQPHHQGPVTAAQSNVRRRTPQGDAELMTRERFSASSRRGDLKKSTTNIASECRSANIVRDHAMILPDDATPKPDGIFGKDMYRGCPGTVENARVSGPQG